MRFAAGARSNKRTVGRFSFCGLSSDPYSLLVSLFRGHGGDGNSGSESTVTLRLCTVPQVLPSRKERRVVSSFSHACSPLFSGSTNGRVIILSISRLYRYAKSSTGSYAMCRVANGTMELCTTISLFFQLNYLNWCSKLE